MMDYILCIRKLNLYQLKIEVQTSDWPLFRIFIERFFRCQKNPHKTKKPDIYLAKEKSVAIFFSFHSQIIRQDAIDQLKQG